MIKIIIATHGNLALELVNCAELIAGKQSNVYVVKNTCDNSLNQVKESIEELLKSFNDEEGSLILTDMFGGTPCNAAALTCANFNTQVLAGVNLSMVLSAFFFSKTMKNAQELAAKVLSDGQKSIIDVKKSITEKMR